MKLGTFGAIMNYALEFEMRAADFYQQSADGVLKERFNEMGHSARRRAARLERARREGVTEMILEPINDLEGDDYQAALGTDGTDDSKITRAIEIELCASHFYSDAAVKLPIKEVARIFSLMAEECRKHRLELEGLRPH
jgi:rubrerythrin